MAAKANKLTKLDTRGVAIVGKGANGKRIALAKAADDKTFEEALLDAIVKGDMPLDDAAVEDMCMRAGLDAQAIETFKAVMKLAHVYADNAAFNALLKTQFATGAGAGGQEPQPGAQPGQPGAPQPGAPMPGQPTPGKPPMPGQEGAGAPPFAAGGAQPGQEPGEGSPKEEQQDAAGTEPGEGTGEEEAGDAAPQGEGQPPKKKKPPFFKSDTTTATADEGAAMNEKEVKEAIAKAVADAAAEVKKAADAQIVELKKQNDELVASNKAQETVAKAQADAIQKMQDDAKLSVWVSKADRELKEIPGETAETLGKQLFDLEKIKPELAAATFATFKKTAEIVRQSGLFSPAGYSGGAPAAAGSAAAEIEKLASEIVAKSAQSGDSPEVARARAEVAIAKSHPALYKRYCDEQEKAAKRS